MIVQIDKILFLKGLGIGICWEPVGTHINTRFSTVIGVCLVDFMLLVFMAV